MKGTKHDQEKPDMTLIPREAMLEMATAFTYGAKKYSRHNFRAGLSISRQLAASLRHIYQFLDGENIDQESGNTHLGSALASIAMACYTLQNKPEFDDRFIAPKTFQNKPLTTDSK